LDACWEPIYFSQGKKPVDFPYESRFSKEEPLIERTGHKLGTITPMACVTTGTRKERTDAKSLACVARERLDKNVRDKHPEIKTVTPGGSTAGHRVSKRKTGKPRIVAVTKRLRHAQAGHCRYKPSKCKHTPSDWGNGWKIQHCRSPSVLKTHSGSPLPSTQPKEKENGKKSEALAMFVKKKEEVTPPGRTSVQHAKRVRTMGEN